MALDPAWIALIGTLCGGIGLKLMEHWLGKSKLKIDEATKLRDELRIEINNQKEEIKELEKEVDRWRTEYYDLRDKYTTLNTEYLIALEKLKQEVESAAKKADKALEPPPAV
jgi:archaellum component FlaC